MWLFLFVSRLNIGLRKGLQYCIDMVYDMLYNIGMNAKEFEEVFVRQMGEKYFTEKELKYNNSVGLFLSPYEFTKYLEYKETLIETDDKRIIQLPLLTFNSKHIYFCLGDDLASILQSYLDLTLEDYKNNGSFLSERYSSMLYKSRIYSEIEGSLNVENVPTTRKRLKELLEDNKPTENTNDIVIKNMKQAIDFVESGEPFNKYNLYLLYNILSKDSLSEENKLLTDNLYRHDGVEVGTYKGCPVGDIEKCMDSLFEYVEKVLNDNENILERILLPHICHYYIVYIHPYFDFNGRTARMVSYWIYSLSKSEYLPPLVSEAINQTKKYYYRSLEMTRDCHNDLTYFLKYILNISIGYLLCYENIEYIGNHIKNKGFTLTETESSYIKKILVSAKGSFTYQDFITYCNITISKQGALKILNKFVKYDVLKEVKSKSKTKLFCINEKKLLFKQQIEL